MIFVMHFHEKKKSHSFDKWTKKIYSYLKSCMYICERCYPNQNCKMRG